MGPSPFLAHGGGWDELMMVVPVLLMLVVMRFTGRRARRKDNRREAAPQDRDAQGQAARGGGVGTPKAREDRG